MKVIKKIICPVLSIISALFLFGCGNSDLENSIPVSGETETVSTVSPESPILTPSPSPVVPAYQTFSDAYVSFVYDSDLFTCTSSENGNSATIDITCPTLPATPKDAHNTIISLATIPNPDPEGASEYEAQLGLSVLTKTLCQSIFPLKDNESIVDERTTYSDCVAEYYMELSDGSKCYAKALNFNDYITTLIMRLCTYSADYNDSFMEIYSSAKSIYGNYDFASAAESTPAPATPTPAASAPAAPTTAPETSSTITAGQRNALKKAKEYLNFSAFSHDGLIGQLEYEGFTSEEATYGADNCGADWNEQALKKAKSYFEFSSFSYSGIIEQLEYEKFSSEQATYAADNCGVDWNEQAVKKAKSYLEFSSFSKDSLIQQLEYEGFTHDQAVHGAQENGY